MQQSVVSSLLYRFLPALLGTKKKRRLDVLSFQAFSILKGFYRTDCFHILGPGAGRRKPFLNIEILPLLHGNTDPFSFVIRFYKCRMLKCFLLV